MSTTRDEQSRVNLATLLTSIGKSVNDARAEMQRARIVADLEEFECTLTLSVEIDEEPLRKPATDEKSAVGLRMLRIYSEPPVRLPSSGAQEQPGAGTLTIRALFSLGREK
ncbi:MAG: hypothetical protein ACK4SA_08395 [Caldilinea sp.]